MELLEWRPQSPAFATSTMDKTAHPHRFLATLPPSACLLLVAVAGCFDPPPPPKLSSNAQTGTTSGGQASGDDTSSTSDRDSEETANDESNGDSEFSTGSTGDPAGYETDSSVSCGAGNGSCMVIPTEWSGPVTVDVASGESGASCDGAAEAFRVHGDIDVPEATCGCECSPATGAECSEAVLTAWAGDASCSETDVFVQNLSPAGDSCNYMPAIDATGTVPLTEASFWTLATESNGGSCAAEAEVDIPPAQYGSEVVGCEVESVDGGCADDESCVDAPEQGEVCIWRDGDHACPGGDFTERTVYFGGDLVDERSCSTCSCGGAEGSCPSSEATLHVGYYCNGEGVGIQADCTEACVGPDCEPYAISASLSLGPAVAVCEPSGGETEGDVTGLEPVTVCCSV